MVMSIFQRNQLTSNHDGVGCVRGSKINPEDMDPFFRSPELRRYRKALEDYITYHVLPGATEEQVAPIRYAFQCGWSYAEKPEYTSVETLVQYGATQKEIEDRRAAISLLRLKERSRVNALKYRTGDLK